MTKRIIYYDALRALAIICVIAIHSIEFVSQANYSSFDIYFAMIFRDSINFAVPLFLALSGYFCYKKDVETKDGYLRFIKRQIPKIFIPFLVWSLFYSLFYLHLELSFKQLLFRFFTFGAAGPFYFISLIIQYYLLLPWLKKMANVKGLFLSMTIALFSCLIIFYIRNFTLIWIPLSLYAGLFSTWMPFFVLGLYIKKNGIKMGNKYMVLFTVLSLLLSIVETYYTKREFNNVGAAFSAIKVSSFLYSFFIILLFFKNVKDIKCHRFSYIGEASFGIYLSHVFFLYVVQKALIKWLPVIADTPLAYWFTQIVITLFVCMLFRYCVLLINKNKAKKYLGA